MIAEGEGQMEGTECEGGPGTPFGVMKGPWVARRGAYVIAIYLLKLTKLCTEISRFIFTNNTSTSCFKRNSS